VSVFVSSSRTSSGAPSGGPIFTMPIALDAVGAAVFVRDDANTPAASSDGGTVAISIVDVAAAPELAEKALRLAVTSGRGGWAVPIDLGGLALPAEGFVVEIDFAGIDGSNLGGFVMPIASFAGATVEGIGAPLFSGVTNAAVQVRTTTTTHARVAPLTGSATTWPATPSEIRCTRGPHRQRLTVRRTNGSDPFAWTMTSRTESPDGSYVHSAAWSGVWESGPAEFNGRTFDALALVVWVPAGYGPTAAHLDVQSLRVLPLP
jgi:hypothetical protein